MARIGFTEVAALPDAADQVAFELLFGSVPGVQNSQPLTIACQQAQIPGMSNEAYTVVLHGHARNFRGRAMNSGTLSVTFIEVGDHLIQRQLIAWKEFVAGQQSGNSQGYLADYSVLAQLISYDTTGRVALRRNIEECFIQEIPDIQHDGSSSAQMSISATFKFSRAYPVDIPLL
ncbi:putative tail tube protein [Rhizobium phage RHEph12]|nr:putative tail tube protein [Rhizobium phage RHEph12]